MRVVVTLPRVKGRIGLTVCGGSPYYRSIFIADVHLKSEAAKCGKIWAGDEIMSVNGNSVKGSGKEYVNRLFKESEGEIVLEMNSWTLADETKGLDITLKALKHRMVETMSQHTVDTLGICHAMLVNDKLTVQLDRLKRMAQFCKAFAHQLCLFLAEFRKLATIHRDMADVFYQLAPQERQTEVSSSFMLVASKLRKIADNVDECIQKCLQTLESVHTLLSKALPDTQLTVNKYADKKFEYLAYCLKAYEMETSEEENFAEYEPWNPIYSIWETDYRDTVHLRHKRRSQFNKMRTVVFDKIKMLEWKLDGDLPMHMETVGAALHAFYEAGAKLNQDSLAVFPISCTIEWNAVTTEYVEQQMARLRASSYSTTNGDSHLDNGVDNGAGNGIDEEEEDEESSETQPLHQ
ncbi:PRKCA-binding protein-like [Sycon ciliatum]|uniref:PRKCA-binding protein-like n=1 Tax=Sycon ciliatum TaxID=27933 RepID=UPI0031F62E74